MTAKYYQFNFPSDVWCNVKFAALGGHKPLDESNDADDIFLMFRHPGARIVSAFHASFHASGMGKGTSNYTFCFYVLFIPSLGHW